LQELLLNKFPEAREVLERLDVPADFLTDTQIAALQTATSAGTPSRGSGSQNTTTTGAVAEHYDAVQHVLPQKLDLPDDAPQQTARPLRGTRKGQGRGTAADVVSTPRKFTSRASAKVLKFIHQFPERETAFQHYPAVKGHPYAIRTDAWPAFLDRFRKEYDPVPLADGQVDLVRRAPDVPSVSPDVPSTTHHQDAEVEPAGSSH
jgi:hypothetical protein